MARPREYDDALRVRLIETAARLLAEEGIHALSTRRIAAETGTSTTAIYSLIGSKDELVRAMFREGFERLAAHLGAVPETDDPVADLGRLGFAYHDMAVESPHLYRLMMDCPVPEFSPTDADIGHSLSTLQILIGCVQRCIDAGAFTGDANDVAMQCWGLNHGLTSLALNGTLGSPAQARAILEHAMRSLLVGFTVIDAPTAATLRP